MRVNKSAEPGQGVNRSEEEEQFSIPLGIERQPKSDFKPPVRVSMDAPAEWLDTPQIEDQIFNQDLCRLVRIETVIFDLSKPEDLAAYNDMQSLAMDKKTNKFITSVDKQWCPDIRSWKVLAEVSQYQFKKLINEDNVYRVRVGDYRIVYQVESGKLLILVLRIGHRKEVYR